MMGSVAVGSFLRADARVASYRRMGVGPPVVCLAGGPLANADYLENLGGLDRVFELLLPDARGTAGTPPPESLTGYGFDELAKDVECFGDHLGMERLRLLAHSAACTVALVYAATHPRRLRSLVLVSPSRWLYPEIEDDTDEILSGRTGEPWYPEMVEARARLAQGATPEDIPSLLVAMAPASYGRWSDRERAHASKMQEVDWEAVRSFWQSKVEGRDIREHLREVECPVLVVTGELDANTGVQAGAAWAACFPHGRHVSIPHVAHMPWVDRPEPFVDEVTSFLVDSG
jgi:proline iminopeptidase